MDSRMQEVLEFMHAMSAAPLQAFGRKGGRRASEKPPRKILRPIFFWISTSSGPYLISQSIIETVDGVENNPQ